VTSKSPAYKFSIQNTTELAFAEARQFRFFSNYVPGLGKHARLQLTWLVLPAAVWQLLLLTDTFGGSSPTRTVDFGCAKVSAQRGKLPAVDA